MTYCSGNLIYLLNFLPNFEFQYFLNIVHVYLHTLNPEILKIYTVKTLDCIFSKTSPEFDSTNAELPKGAQLFLSAKREKLQRRYVNYRRPHVANANNYCYPNVSRSNVSVTWLGGHNLRIKPRL